MLAQEPFDGEDAGAAVLPIGLQIVSRAWADSKVLNAGYAFEQATEWHRTLPPLAQDHPADL